VPTGCKIDAELHRATRELPLRLLERRSRVARFPLDDHRAERRVGKVRQREHEAVDLEHLGAGDMGAPHTLRRDDSVREAFGIVHGGESARNTVPPRSQGTPDRLVRR
jgi:hypothetical protein